MEKPKCKVCGERPARSNGKGQFKARCWKCSDNKLDKMNSKQRRWQALRRKYLTGTCSSCGFVAVDMCQMDIDHIDGNHTNDTPENLQELCANCHRLKTQLNEDWLGTVSTKVVIKSDGAQVPKPPVKMPT